jgi:hypothetical protein
MSDESQYIPGIFNYCDRWCERCPFTSRCRLFADEAKLRKELDTANRHEPDEADNAAFWSVVDEAALQAFDSADELDPEFDAEYEERESKLEELTDRDPLVRLSHDYGMEVTRWLNENEKQLPSERGRFREARDCVTPAEAVEVIGWHHFQIGVKLARATRGRFEAEEEIEEAGEEWDIGIDWEDDDEDDVDLAEIHQQDADGSAKVALIGIERSLGAWTILRSALPEQDARIQAFQRQLARLRRLLDAAFPAARTFHRPGFDD